MFIFLFFILVFVKEEINQRITATIEVYKGSKLQNNHPYTLRFKEDKDGWRSELDTRLQLENQKSLSSTKPKEVTFTSSQTQDDSGSINVGDTFIIIDELEPKKVGKGKVTAIQHVLPTKSF